AIALFVFARLVLERGGWVNRSRVARWAGLAVLLAPSLLAAPSGLPASAAERNLYSLGYEVATAEPPPLRSPVELEPDTRGAPAHIVWLIDESVAYRQFQDIVAPHLGSIAHVD